LFFLFQNHQAAFNWQDNTKGKILPHPGTSQFARDRQFPALRFPSWKLFPSQGIRPASQSELLSASLLDFSRESAKPFAPTTLFKRNRIRSASQSDLLPTSLLDFSRESLKPFAPTTLFKRNRTRSASQSDLLPASLLDFSRKA